MEATFQNISLVVLSFMFVILALYCRLKINELSTWKRLTNTNLGIIARDRVRIVSQAIAIEQLIKQLEAKESIIDKNKDLENAFADCSNELNLANSDRLTAYERLAEAKSDINEIADKSIEQSKTIDELQKSKEYYKAKADHEKLPGKVNNSDQWLCLVDNTPQFKKGEIYKEGMKSKWDDLLHLECDEGMFMVSKSNFKLVMEKNQVSNQKEIN